jgi:hypothetical protein
MEHIKNHIIQGKDAVHDNIKEHLAKARELHTLASHMLKVTYAELKEPKLLIQSLEHIFISGQESLLALLTFCRHHGLIPPFHKTLDSLLLHVGEIGPKLGIEKKDYEFIEKLKDLLVFRKESPIEFSRNGDYIVCSDAYHTVRVDHAFVYDMIQKTKKLEQKIGETLHGYV